MKKPLLLLGTCSVIIGAVTFLYSSPDKKPGNSLSTSRTNRNGVSEQNPEYGQNGSSFASKSPASTTQTLGPEEEAQIDRVVDDAMFKRFGPEALQQKMDEELVETEQLPLAPI